MISQPTVLILGAGASQPYGYPTGEELREYIIDHFIHDIEEYFGDQMTKGVLEVKWIKPAGNFVETFSKSTTQSIDLFLGRNPEYAPIGKKAIILSIHKAECNSQFREQVNNRNHDWYSYFYRILTSDLVEKEDYARFSENKISIITFNYDRSLEHFLYESLSNSFSSAPKEEIKKLICGIPTIHVFNQIAGLDWQNLPSKIAYGNRTGLDYVSVTNIADQINTIYDNEDNPELTKAQTLIRQAKNIFFLGFGFAKENLNLLKIPDILSSEQMIHCTGYKLDAQEIAEIKTIFTRDSKTGQKTRVKPNYLHVEDLDSYALLKKFSCFLKPL